MVIELDVSDGCFEIHTAYNDVQVVIVVEHTTTVTRLKKCIAEEFGLDAGEMRLLLRGSDMEDERTMMQHGIADGATLCMTRRGRGGAVIKQHLKRADIAKTLHNKMKKAIAHVLKVVIDTMLLVGVQLGLCLHGSFSMKT